MRMPHWLNSILFGDPLPPPDPVADTTLPTTAALAPQPDGFWITDEQTRDAQRRDRERRQLGARWATADDLDEGWGSRADRTRAYFVEPTFTANPEDDHRMSTDPTNTDPIDLDLDDSRATGRAAVPVSAPPAPKAAPTWSAEANERPADPLTDPIADSGVHHLDEAPPTIRAVCTHCEGHGYMDRPVNDVLRETVGMIPVDGGDDVIREFYRRLLAAAPDLEPLFPPDLLTAATKDGASPGAMQRDRLLNAIVAVSDLYGAGNDAMDRLDVALGVYGRSHAAFARPDGTTSGATEAEYEAVIDVFLGLMADALGDKFTTAHQTVWKEALDYVKVGMLWNQFHSGMRMPRYPRTAADVGSHAQ